MPGPRRHTPAVGRRQPRVVPPTARVVVPLSATAADRDRLRRLAATAGTSVGGLLSTVSAVTVVTSCRGCPWWAVDACDHGALSADADAAYASERDGSPPPADCPLRGGATVVRLGA